MTKIKIDPTLAVSLLTPSEALELLSIHLERRRKRVHTFMDAGIALMGCDMDLSSIKAKFKNLKADDLVLSGKNMTAMGHGVAFWEDKVGWTFLETDKAKIEAIHKLRKIKYK